MDGHLTKGQLELLRFLAGTTSAPPSSVRRANYELLARLDLTLRDGRGKVRASGAGKALLAEIDQAGGQT